MSGTTIRARRPGSLRTPKRILRLRGDEDLVARARQGDERAFEVLYERHLPGILAFSRHMLGDPQEAEDAVQQVFVAASSELADGERPLHLRAWLYTVARNRCLSMLRARRERPVEDVELSTAGLQDEVAQRADLQELLGDLYDLPDDQRAALVLSELDDLPHAEIASVLGCKAHNVKGLVFRARAGLMERHEAREAPCSEIRAELASARRGGLRRGRLRHHLKACSGCAAYLEDLRSQRSLLALALPVAPSAGLKPAVLGSIGLGGGAAAGGLVALGTAGTAATVAVTAVVAGAAGLAGHGPLGNDPKRNTSSPTAAPGPAKAPAAAALRPAGEPGADRSGAASQRGAPGARDRKRRRPARRSLGGRGQSQSATVRRAKGRGPAAGTKGAKGTNPQRAGTRGKSGSARGAPRGGGKPPESSSGPPAVVHERAKPPSTRGLPKPKARSAPKPVAVAPEKPKQR